MATKKLSDFGIKAPRGMGVVETAAPPAVPGLSSFSKWVPLICAGAAVGVSVLALKEIKNVRKELMNMKKEQIAPVTNSVGPDPELTKKIELMDQQLRKITQYLSNQNKPKAEVDQPVVKKVVKPETINIINKEPVVQAEEEEEVEYEEVTDDEA